MPAKIVDHRICILKEIIRATLREVEHVHTHRAEAGNRQLAQRSGSTRNTGIVKTECGFSVFSLLEIQPWRSAQYCHILNKLRVQQEGRIRKILRRYQEWVTYFLKAQTSSVKRKSKLICGP